jgi:hypothetical protein
MPAMIKACMSSLDIYIVRVEHAAIGWPLGTGLCLARLSSCLGLAAAIS